MRLQAIVTGPAGHQRCFKGCLLLAGLFISGLLMIGCVGPVRVRETRQSTIVEVDKADGLTQRIGVILANVSKDPMEQKTGERFMTTFLASMRQANHQLTVVPENNKAFPDVLNVLKRSGAGAVVDVFDISEIARQKGYQGFAVARIIEQRRYIQDTGILWWRKSHHFLSFIISVDLYDPFTAAKMLSVVEEKNTRISPEEYQQLSDKTAFLTKKFNQMVNSVAEAAGKKIAGCMARQPWKTTVLTVDKGVVILASGGQSGLSTSDRLVVYKAQRVMKGLPGERFVVPGYRAGQIRIDAIEGRFVRAVIEGPADIEAGDLVLRP